MKVGQIVVCIKSHSWGIYKEGEQYEFEYYFTCPCGYISLKLKGLTHNYGTGGATCTKCQMSHKYTFYAKCENFVPIDDWNHAQHMVNELVEETLIPIEI